MNLVKIFKSGQTYMSICPQDRELAYSFPELKIINYIKTATKFLPPLIVGLIVWQYYMNAQIAVTSITILFALSLPIQGIFWLGKRSQSPLPLNLVDCYNHIRTQLISKNVLANSKKNDNKLTFEDFMKLLNLAKIHLGSYFGQNNDSPPSYKE
ncbi:hypothetical protein A9G11_06925 [Gilliamella sp. wkB108]|uniref:terminus macrodomain insulation protein YfbV n=1 Tax=Gilliamella sp. wkB108 TaxID=3120256 RepID=UPI00080EDE88|nr:terminus macrodomain insulation protein YfbV [Gilliamella apicola]OCG22628.1 hypothetical protein A9G11_06925 [Gilliamella apicola]